MLKFSNLLLLSAAVLPLPALCQEATPQDDIIVTALGAEQPETETGRAVTVIDRETLERRQTVSVAEILATTPGVTVTRNGGPGALTAVRIRGAEGEQTLVLIDGVRVNDPASPGGAFDFGNLLAGAVERVEVLRGSGSVVWGSQAIGGVVNVITRAPTEGLAASGNIEVGSDETVFANAAISGSSGVVSGALTGGYLSTNGFSSAASGSEADGYRQYGATGRLGVEFAPGIGLDLRGYYANSRLELDGYPPPFYGFADTAEYSTAEEIYGYAGVHADLLDGRFRNRAAFTIADIARDNYDPSLSSTPAFFGRGRSERYEYQGDLALIDQVRAVFGVEHEDSRFTDGGPTEHAGITSGYAELVVKPVEMLTLTAGARQVDHSRFGSHTIVSANSALALGSGTRLRASYAEGFKAPTLYQLFSAYGTETLRPETSRGWDIGAEQSFLAGRARASVTWFRRDTRNQIDFIFCSPADVTNPTTICFDRPFGTYDNVARTRAEGVEFELALRPVDALSVSASYTYLRARNRTAGFNLGNDLARRPRHSLSASVDYTLPFGLSLGSTVLMVGDSFDNAGNTTRLDGYVVADFRAELPVADRFAIYGRVENAFDERYQTVAGYNTPPRRAFAGVRLKLDR